MMKILDTKNVVNIIDFGAKSNVEILQTDKIQATIDAENISIIGEKGSCIDGNNCFDAQGEELFRGPHGITFFNCSNIFLKGYTVENSGN